MQRRNFLQLLAAIPFVGWMVPKAKPTLEDRLIESYRMYWVGRHKNGQWVRELMTEEGKDQALAEWKLRQNLIS